MKYLIFEDYDSANKWRRAHDFLGSAGEGSGLHRFFLDMFGSVNPYPNDMGTTEFTSVMNLNGGRYIYQGQPLGGYCIELYDRIYQGLIDRSLWSEACDILASPTLILDYLEIEHLAI